MRTSRLWRYTVGLSPRLAEAVFVENDTRFSIDVSTTRSRRFLLLTSASETTTAVHFLSAAEPQGMGKYSIELQLLHAFRRSRPTLHSMSPNWPISALAFALAVPTRSSCPSNRHSCLVRL